MRYFLEDKRTNNKVDVEIINKNLNIDDFSYAYSLILNEYFNMKNKEKIKNFLEYLKEKLNDPYLNNLLEETNFVYENKIVTDKEGQYKISYILRDGDIIVYIAGSYFWVENKKDGKKYFYYTD